MANITFNIPDNKIGKIINAMKGLYPIPQIEDPENEGEMINEFTDGEWAKEALRRWVVQQVARYEQKVAMDVIEFNPDNGLLS